MSTEQQQLNKKWVQLMVEAEQTTSRKEARHLINKATELRSAMAIPWDDTPPSCYTNFD